MSDQIYNKVITIASKEEVLTKNKKNTTVKITDQSGAKFVFWKKKADGTPSAVAEQFRAMGLDEGSTVKIGYVDEAYEDAQGQSRVSSKIINFQETQEQPAQVSSEPKKTAPKPNSYVKEPSEPTDWDEIAVGKCQTVFLAAFIQSGKTISEAKLQVTMARQLAELVVYGTQKQVQTYGADEVPLPEVPLPEAPPEVPEVDVENIPF